MEEMKIVYLPPGELTPYKKNAKKHPDKQVEHIANSIREFGFRQPVVVDENNVIVIGHGRVMAANKLGLDSVPVVRADDLTEEQIKALRLADNKTNESEWDLELLDAELVDLALDFDMAEFGFEDDFKNHEWFDREERDGKNREEGNDEYNDFLEKFETKKTTDDCYTPENIYDAVADWVGAEYGVDRSKFVRPFYPGGDYQKEKYPEGCVVVDNPPFSIITDIVRFYCDSDVRFFLFAPNLTLWSGNSEKSTYIATGVQITYENGAEITTSFITNLDKCQVRTAPALYKTIKTINDKNTGDVQAEMPKYIYPKEVITASMVARWCKYGVDFEIDKNECYFVRALDAQKEQDKTIYGSGYLLSEDAARRCAEAEKAANEKAAAIKWQLSEREMEIVRSLGK